MSPQELYEIAKQYRDAGLSVIGSKQKGTYQNWTHLQKRVPTDDEMYHSFVAKKSTWIAIVTGEGSGNLEVIDCDLQYDESGTLWDRFWPEVVEYYKGEPPFAVVKSRSGGMHIYYRCEEIQGNIDLAKQQYEGEPKAVIQTRGAGGLIMVPPSPGYSFLDDRIPYHIPTITPEEREDLFTICRSYNQVFESSADPSTSEKNYRKSNHSFKVTPWHDYNASDAFEDLLIEAGWTKVSQGKVRDKWRRPGKDEGHSATFHKENRWFYAFSSNQSDFECNTYYTPYDIYLKLHAKNSKQTAVSDLLDQGYGQPYTTSELLLMQKATEHFKAGDFMSVIRKVLAQDINSMVEGGECTSEEAQELLDEAERRAEFEKNAWWEENHKTGKLFINELAFRDFLFQQGYRLFVNDEEAETFRLIRIDYIKHCMYHVHLDNFKKELEQWVNSKEEELDILTRRKVLNLLMKTSDAKYKSIIDFLPRLNHSDVRFLKKAGNDKVQYFTFRNTVVKVTTDDYQLIQYHDLDPDMLVWRRDVKPRPFTLLDIELEDEFNQCPIWIFFKRICGIKKEIEQLSHDVELQEQHPVLYHRFMALITTVGYLISAYKDVSSPYAPIFEENTESSEKGGGTGKGLIFQIVGIIRNVVNIDCKLIDPTDDFAFSTVTLDTDVVHLEDVEKSFKPTSINNVISSGLTLRRKYEHAFVLDYPNSPKIAISSNYSLSDDAEFEKRRQKKIYLERHYNKDFKPEHELGGKLFTEDWTDDQYNLCYNILMYCLQAYMVHGIVESVTPEMVTNKYLLERYKQGFVDFCSDLTMDDRLGKWQDLKELRQTFLKRSEESEKFWGPERFARSVKDYLTRTGWKWDAQRISINAAEKVPGICIVRLGDNIPEAAKSNIYGYLF